MVKIAIFASGTGTNAREIIKHLKNNPSISVDLVVSNKPTAGVLKIAESYNLETATITKSDFFNSEKILEKLSIYNIDLIVLAGFLLLVPEYLVNSFENRIINIHPALLPKYGGKGMYGDNVHKAVIENREKESGITIHYVNKHFDEGEIIFQASCEVTPEDSIKSLSTKIHSLEHKHFPLIVEQVATNLL